MHPATLRRMFARLRQLIIAFFVYNLINVVASFHIFVDVASSISISMKRKDLLGAGSKINGYERAAAAFLFFDFLLSILACIFAVKAIDEARAAYCVMPVYDARY